MFRFGSAHLPNDPDTQLAHWGARLIYNEVLDGFSGIVGDRQTPDGPADLIEQRIFPHMDDFMGILREHMEYGAYNADPRIRFDNGEVLAVTFGDDVVVVASAQGSYGYLYVSAAVLKPEEPITLETAGFIKDGKVTITYPPTDAEIDAEGMELRKSRAERILDDEMSLF